MYELKFDTEVCAVCGTYDCLMKCQYQTFDQESARAERENLNRGDDSRVLHDCATCYACEEYCQKGNHPFYQIAELQEAKDIWPAPKPIVHQQMKMYAPKGDFQDHHQEIKGKALDLCLFPALKGTIQGELYEDTSLIMGRDVFCNLVYLHFAKVSVIKERVPQVIENLASTHLEELICYHDECYGLYASWAPAHGIDVPFKPTHLFEHLRDQIRAKLAQDPQNVKKLGIKVAYQRPCSARLTPESEPFLDEILELIGVERVERTYDRENALCCGAVLRAQGRDELAEDLNERNIQDMLDFGASMTLFNCPACYSTLNQMVTEQGLKPIMVSDLCRLAIGEIA